MESGARPTLPQVSPIWPLSAAARQDGRAFLHSGPMTAVNGQRSKWLAGLPTRASDWWVVAHLGLTFGVVALAYTSPWLWTLLLWVPIHWFLALHLVAAEHNHGHVAISRSAVTNRVLDQLLLLATGIPMFCWRTVHRTQHHASPWTARDHSSPFRFDGAESPARPVSYRRYQLTYLPRFVSAAVREIWRQSPPETRRVQRKGEVWFSLLVFLVVQAVLIAAFGPLRWFLVSALTWVVCGCTLGAANYLQHWQTHRGGDRHEAWTFTCRWHNWLNYNAGYHELHHRRPSMHWSDLARTHRRAPDYCSPELLEEGLFPAYRGGRGLRRWFAARGLRGGLS